MLLVGVVARCVGVVVVPCRTQPLFLVAGIVSGLVVRGMEGLASSFTNAAFPTYQVCIHEWY